MSGSAVALSERDISYAGTPREASAYAPATIESWQADGWTRTEQRLHELLRLGQDWDGAGAVPPSQEALETVIEYLQKLHSENVAPPTALSPTGLGSVVLEWHLGDTYLEAEIAGSSTIGWMERDSNGSVNVW